MTMSPTHFFKTASGIAAAAIPLAVTGTPITLTPAMVKGMVDYLHYGESASGFIAAVELFGMMGGAFVFTFFGARMNHRIFFTAGLLIAASANLACVLLLAYKAAWCFIPMRALAGFGAGLTTTLAWALLGSSHTPERDLGWGVAAVMAYPVLGFWALPWLLAQGGYDGLLLGYTGALLLSLLAVPYLSSLESPEDALTAGGVTLLSLPGIAALISFMSLQIAFPAAYTYMSLIGQHAGLDDAAVNSTLSISLVFGIAGALSVSWICKRLGYLVSALLMLGGGTLTILAFIWPAGRWLFLALNCGFQFAWNAGFPLILSLIALRGRSPVLMRFAIPLQFVGMAIAPTFAATLVAPTGYTKVLIGCGVISTFTMIALLPLLMHKPRESCGAASY